jgi:protein transport protein SEC24
MSQQYPASGQEGYGQQPPVQPYENYDQASPTATAPQPGAATAQAGRKKRAYAGQAYEFGAGANAGLGGQPQAGGAYPGFSTQQEAAGYPQGGYQQNPAAVQENATPMYPGQDPAVGGYQPPGATYPAPGGASGLGGVTQQFGQMDLSQKPVPAAPPPQQQQQRAPVLNQLYPTDLSNQPLNVAELDFPPPPAILPANVCQVHLSLGTGTDP